MKWIFIVLLALPFLLRRHTKILGAKKSDTYWGGAPSVIIWNICYFVIVILTAYELLFGGAPSIVAGVAGYLILWFAIFLRRSALKKLSTFYSVFIVVQSDHKIISSGPYRFLRHPLHLGLFLEMTGLSMIAGNRMAYIVLSVSFLVLLVRNINEEGALKNALGKEYETFSTRAWDLIDLLPSFIKRGR